MKCTQRLYLTADREKVVGEGDASAATLYAVPGDEIPDSAAEKFGLVDGALPAKGGPKKDNAPANKGGKAPANKGAEGEGEAK